MCAVCISIFFMLFPRLLTSFSSRVFSCYILSRPFLMFLDFNMSLFHILASFSYALYYSWCHVLILCTRSVWCSKLSHRTLS
jgi:hypothetical protein